MKLIKALNEQANKIDPAKSKFKYLDVDSIEGVNDILEGDFSNDAPAREVMQKLIDQYFEKDLGRMSDQDIKDMIGDDLQMLEFEPAQVEKMIVHIFKEVSKELNNE